MATTPQEPLDSNQPETSQPQLHANLSASFVIPKQVLLKAGGPAAQKILWDRFQKVVTQRFGAQAATALATAAGDGPFPIGDLISAGIALKTAWDIYQLWDELWDEALEQTQTSQSSPPAPVRSEPVQTPTSTPPVSEPLPTVSQPVQSPSSAANHSIQSPPTSQAATHSAQQALQAKIQADRARFETEMAQIEANYNQALAQITQEGAAKLQGQRLALVESQLSNYSPVEQGALIAQVVHEYNQSLEESEQPLEAQNLSQDDLYRLEIPLLDTMIRNPPGFLEDALAEIISGSAIQAPPMPRVPTTPGQTTVIPPPTAPPKPTEKEPVIDLPIPKPVAPTGDPQKAHPSDNKPPKPPDQKTPPPEITVAKMIAALTALKAAQEVGDKIRETREEEEENQQDKQEQEAPDQNSSSQIVAREESSDGNANPEGESTEEEQTDEGSDSEENQPLTEQEKLTKKYAGRSIDSLTPEEKAELEQGYKIVEPTDQDPYIRRKPGESGRPPLHLEKTDGRYVITEGPSKANQRASDPERMKRNFEEEYDTEPPEDHDLHHVYTDKAWRETELAQEAEKRGIADVDDGEGLIALPSHAEAFDDNSEKVTELEAKGGLAKIAHPGSHPEAQKRVEELIKAAEADLADKYGSVEDAPDEAIQQKIHKIRRTLRQELQDAAQNHKNGERIQQEYIDPAYPLKNKGGQKTDQTYPRISEDTQPSQPTAQVTSLNRSNPELQAATAEFREAIREIPTYAQDYPYTFSVDRNLTVQALRQPSLNEQQQAVMILSAAEKQLSQNGQPNAEGQSFIHGPVYSVMGDAQKLTLLSSETYLEIASYNKLDGTVTVEEPFTGTEQDLARQSQQVMLASITARQNASKVPAPSLDQLELG